MRRARLRLALTVAALFASRLAAGAAEDHPLVSRYPGAEILASESKAYDAFALPVGPVHLKQVTPSRWDPLPPKTTALEGKVTRIVYSNPSGRSSLEIFRNYEQALAKAGFESLFTCAGKQCADSGTNSDVEGVGRWCFEGLDCEDVMRYVAAKLARPEGDVYVAVKVLVNGYSTGGTVVSIVELKPMEAGLVTVKSAAVLSSDIGSTGHSAVYGVYFDTGKAIVKPESGPTLAEIVKLLQDNPTMKLHVVGHTDNVGTMAFNMTLSKQRADAVVAELVSKHKVAAARLDSAGVGSLSPVTTNRTEEGRAKNRRVELVEQ